MRVRLWHGMLIVSATGIVVTMMMHSGWRVRQLARPRRCWVAGERARSEVSLDSAHALSHLLLLRCWACAPRWPMQLTFGAAAGFCSGYALKQVGKAAAFTFGAAFIAVQVLRYYGVISDVSWGRC